MRRKCFNNVLKNKKSQAAVEFLLTYGWAILAALVALGALVYFGVTNPAKTLPDKCTFSNDFNCQDFYVTVPSNVSIRLTNGLGQTIYSPQCACTSGTFLGTCVMPNGDWSPDTVRELNCTKIVGATFIQKDRAKATIVLNYKKLPTGYNQTAQGDVYSTVQ